MKYTIKYKQGMFWNTIKNVVEDGYFAESGVRWFMQDDGVVIEIPAHKTVFKFSKERTELVKLNQVKNNGN